MRARNTVSKQMAMLYHTANRKAKGTPHDKLVALIGWPPDYSRRPATLDSFFVRLCRGHWPRSYSVPPCTT